MLPLFVLFIGGLLVFAAIARARRRSSPGSWISILALVAVTLWLASLTREQVAEEVPGAPDAAVQTETTVPPPAAQERPSPFPAGNNNGPAN